MPLLEGYLGVSCHFETPWSIPVAAGSRPDPAPERPLVREGVQACGSPLRWRRHAHEVIAEAGLRRDLTQTLHDLVEGVLRGWRPESRVCAPGHALLCEVTGRHQATVTRGLSRLEEMGLIHTVREGTVVWAGESTRNLRAEYVLLVPATRRAVTGWNVSIAPRTKAERYAAAESMQARSVELAQVSARALASRLRRWWAAGWTPVELLRAIDNDATGRRWTYTMQDGGKPRNVLAWLSWRLKHHLTSDGSIPVGPGLAAQHEREERAAERAAERTRETQRASAQVIAAKRAEINAALREARSKHRNADPYESSTLVRESLIAREARSGSQRIDRQVLELARQEARREAACSGSAGTSRSRRSRSSAVSAVLRELAAGRERARLTTSGRAPVDERPAARPGVPGAEAVRRALRIH